MLANDCAAENAAPLRMLTNDCAAENAAPLRMLTRAYFDFFFDLPGAALTFGSEGPGAHVV
jgi:hypothetical protein